MTRRESVVPVPIELPMGDAYLWWHPRFQDDPGHAWWRKALLDAFLARR